jgi:hypothetical protein
MGDPLRCEAGRLQDDLGGLEQHVRGDGEAERLGSRLRSGRPLAPCAVPVHVARKAAPAARCLGDASANCTRAWPTRWPL